MRIARLAGGWLVHGTVLSVLAYCGSRLIHAAVDWEGVVPGTLSATGVRLVDLAFIGIFLLFGGILLLCVKERFAAEKATRQWSDVLEATADGFLTVNQEGAIVFVSPGMANLLGYERAELLGQPASLVLPGPGPKNAPPWGKGLSGTGSIARGKVRELTGRRKDGAKLILEARISAPPSAGQDRLTTVVVRDVTRTKATTEMLHAREAHLRMIVEQMPVILWTTDNDLHITSTLGAGLAALNLKANQVIGLSMLECLGRDSVEETPIAAHLRAVRGQSLSYEMEWKGRTFQVRVDPLRDSEKTIVGTVGILLDITDQKQTFAELKARERQQAAVASLGLQALTSLSLEKLMSEATAAVGRTLEIPFCEVMEYVPDERLFRMRAEAGWGARHPDAGDRTLGLESQAGYSLRKGEAVILDDLAEEHRFRALENRLDESIVNSITAVIHGKAGPYGVLGAHATDERKFTRDDLHFVQAVANILAARLARHQDISERQRLEEQLRQAQKMEAIGRLAGGVAHDFNNLVCIITGYSELLARNLHEKDRCQEFAKEIHKAGERAASLTRQLLAFSRKQMLVLRTLSLNTLLVEMQKMLRRLIGEDIELVTQLDPALYPVRADAGQIEQIVMNLAVNARDAMPTGGRLTLGTAGVVLDDAAVRNRPGVSPGAYAVLSVSDTGCGMDPETKAHLFEPFFTTKGTGKGTGLGLATVYGIVKQSGGHIEVESKPGCGTTFSIYLPRAEEAAGAAEKNPPRPEESHGTETILLVEDEEGVRALACQVLQQKGYRVLPASNGEEAVALWEKESARIDLLLTDVVMPKLSGSVLAQRLRKLRPDLQVLFMSGFTESALVRNEVQTGDVECLLKPFLPADLARMVRQTLDREPPRTRDAKPNGQGQSRLVHAES